MQLPHQLTLTLASYILYISIGIVNAHWIETPTPAYLQICQKVDKNLTECLKKSIETFSTVLINGIPNLDIPSLDPLEIGHLFKSEKRKHGVHIKTEDVVVMGILKFKIDDLQYVHGKLYTVDVSFPKLQIEGACNVFGKIQEFTFNENCSFVETLYHSSGRVRARFSHTPNGFLVHTDRIDVNINAGKGVAKLYDLTKGRRILDQYEINNIVNSNFHEMNNELIPVVEKILQHQLKEMSHKLLGHFSYGQIFPLSF